MSETNSPSFKLGQADGRADRQLVETCPGVPPIGPQPPDPAYPVMYLRGYWRVMVGAEPHICVAECRRK